MEGDNTIAIILSVLALVSVFVLGAIVIFQENARIEQYDSNSADLITLQNAINTQANSVAKTQDLVTALQATVNRISSNPVDHNTIVDLESDMSEIDYCSGRYNDAEDFEDFANCVRKRLD